MFGICKGNMFVHLTSIEYLLQSWNVFIYLPNIELMLTFIGHCAENLNVNLK